VGAWPNHVEPGQIRVRQIPFGAPSLARKSGDALSGEATTSTHMRFPDYCGFVLSVSEIVVAGALVA
jgi:hypothetical protein